MLFGDVLNSKTVGRFELAVLLWPDRNFKGSKNLQSILLLVAVAPAHGYE